MFLTKLNSLYPSLTYSETKIADYLLANRGEAFEFTSSELASFLDVSQSTIIRFSQKLGYKSFKNMILDLSRTSEEKDIEEIQLKDSTYTTNEKIRNHFTKLINIADEINPSEVIDEAVNTLYHAPFVYCFGYLATSAMALHMSWLLSELGIPSHYSDNVFDTAIRFRSCPKNSVIILFSKSGETKAVAEVAQTAKQFGLTTIGLTNMSKNSLSPHLDIWIKTMYSTAKTRFLSYTELSSHLYMIDVLILNLYKRDFPRFKNAVITYQEIVKPK